jgi:heavy metal sensor kinase
MNPRSIHFRLIGLYAGLLAIVMLAVEGYTYKRLEYFLHATLRKSLEHRAMQITQGILAEIPERGESYVSSEIEARYAPALNDKFVRVTKTSGAVIYRSGPPNNHSFTPESVPPDTASSGPGKLIRTEHFPDGNALLIASLSSSIATSTYLVEVGASLAEANRVLQALLVSLSFVFLVLMTVAVLGGHVLMKRGMIPVKNIMAAAQDITLHHLNRRLPVSDSGDEIAGLSIALNQMIARLDESFQHTSRFTADASHELRTPLTIIHGEVETILKARQLDPELRDDLESLHHEVLGLVRIVERLFALARMDAGQIQAERIRLNLGTLVETTAEQMCVLAVDKQIQLECKIQQPTEVDGDRSGLKQTIVNLLDNAIKYTPQNGRVSLGVYAQNNAVIFEVADTGCGVTESELPRLFQRFYRTQAVRSSNVDGVGLGLSIVHSVCTAHGGSVTATNRSPSGLKITVSLPKATT